MSLLKNAKISQSKDKSMGNENFLTPKNIKIFVGIVIPLFIASVGLPTLGVSHFGGKKSDSIIERVIQQEVLLEAMVGQGKRISELLIKHGEAIVYLKDEILGLKDSTNSLHKELYDLNGRVGRLEGAK